jgi:hypothetical protein
MMSSPDTDPYADPVDPHRERLSIDELAAVTGVSWRTVHYYIQRRLTPVTAASSSMESRSRCGSTGSA